MKKLLLFITAALLAVLAYAVTVDRRYSEAVAPLHERADSGDVVAMYRLSMIYEEGMPGCPADTAMAVDMLHRSAMGGYSPAMNYLGYCYGIGHLGLRQDPEGALYWIERAASADSPEPRAFNNLGAMLLHGALGVKRDYEKARYWLTKGSEAGLASSAAMLADIYLQGLGVPPDTARAMPLLRKAAGAGIRDAAVQLAEMVLPGTDTLSPAQMLETALPYFNERIMQVAIPLITKAAEADLPLAVAILAQCTAEGTGVTYDYARSVELYARAAALGEPHAQFILAETLQAFPDLLADKPELIAAIIGHEECDDGYVPLSQILYERAAAAGITDAAVAIKPLRPASH